MYIKKISPAKIHLFICKILELVVLNDNLLQIKNASCRFLFVLDYMHLRNSSLVEFKG